MSDLPENTTPAPEDLAPTLTVESVSRTPLQGRSKASLERMLAAARDLMIERGNEDFTLQEVSQRGNVSIGSIYLRFESKDNLVRAVLAKGLADLAESEDAMFAQLTRTCTTLAQFVPQFVDAYAEVLRINAPLLRLAMLRAEQDPLVEVPGKLAGDSALERATQALRQFEHEFGGSAHAVRARSAYHIIFATLARQLSLGSTRESVSGFDWEELKRELARMCLAYLRDS
jgi:AcrR family transcriptional regulator